MGLGGVLLVRAAVADVGVHPQQHGSFALGGGGLEGRAQRVEVVAVCHLDDPPAIGGEAPGHVFGKRERGGAVDGDPVVVVDQLELAEPLVTGERAGLRGDALHQVAVSGENPDAVIEERESGPVEPSGEQPLGHRHADGGGHSLAERAGRHLDAGGQAALRVSRGARTELAEPLRSSASGRSKPARWSSE